MSPKDMKDIEEELKLVNVTDVQEGGKRRKSKKSSKKASKKA